MQYSATGRIGTLTRSVPGCRYSIDYHPSDGSLLMVDCDRQLQNLAANSSTPTNVAVGTQVTRARWLWAGTEFIYSAGGQLRRAAYATPGSSTVVLATSAHDFFATAHSSNRALGTESRRIDLIDVDGQAVTASGLEVGECPHFSPNDAMFLFMANFGKQLMIRSLSGGQPTQVGGKGNYSSADWRK